MEGIIMPEVIIYNALESIVKCVRKDLTENKDNEKASILYRLLGENIDRKPIMMNRWDFFKQAKKIFTNKNNLSVNFGYNFDVANIIALHIVLPSEQAAESAIGQDEGYNIMIDDEGMITEFFSQNFQSNYQIMITSNNSSEILTVYHILKSMLLMIVPHLETMGLRLCKFSGNDIVFKDDLMPNGMFHKVLNINFNYELKVPQMLQRDIVKKIVFDGHLLENIKDECGRCDNLNQEQL